MQTFNNNETGIAVMIEEIAGGYAGYKLTHVSFEVDVPDSNNTIEIRNYPAGKLDAAIAYAKTCINS
jgi:hypothetical protein